MCVCRMAMSICNVPVATTLYINGVSSSCIHTHILTSFLLKYQDFNLLAVVFGNILEYTAHAILKMVAIPYTQLLHSDDNITILPQHYRIVGFFEVLKFHEFCGFDGFVKFKPSKKSTKNVEYYQHYRSHELQGRPFVKIKL